MSVSRQRHWRVLGEVSERFQDRWWLGIPRGRNLKVFNSTIYMHEFENDVPAFRRLASSCGK